MKPSPTRGRGLSAPPSHGARPGRKARPSPRGQGRRFRKLQLKAARQRFYSNSGDSLCAGSDRTHALPRPNLFALPSLRDLSRRPESLLRDYQGITRRHVGTGPGSPDDTQAALATSDPWVGDVIQSSGGLVSREAFVALPERAVLAAFAAGGVSASEARNSVLYRLAKAKESSTLKGLKALKAESSAHRARFILHGGSQLDAQLSFVGRALPPASLEARRAALVQHREDMTSTFETDVDTLTLARGFARSWANSHLARARAPLGELQWPSSSSCLEMGTGRGGTLKFLLGAVSNRELPVAVPEDAEGGVTALHAKFLDYAMGEFRKDPVPRHRVACLAERGVKTRVVTVGPAWAQVLGHAVRKRLLRALKSCPGTYAPLSGAHDSELGTIFEGGHSEVLVSTDLTRASDLLPFDLLSAIIDGLEESGRLSPLEVEILRALSGPQRLSYGKDEVLSSRGSLMGLPTTWVLLSLVHLFWMDEVKRSSPPGQLRRRHRFSICGDDALLATTHDGAEIYKSAVALCGGTPSEGKHFECSSGVVRRGVFLEKILEFPVRDGLLGPMSRVPVIPVRGLTSQGLPRVFKGSEPVVCSSVGITQVMVIDSILQEQGPSALAPLRNYALRRVPWLERYAVKELSLTPGLPLRVGGYPLSPSFEETEENRAFLFLSEGNFRGVAQFGLAVSRETDPDWIAVSSWARADAEGPLNPAGWFPPLLAEEEGPLLPTQVRFPIPLTEYGPGADIVVFPTREYLDRATLAYFMQVKTYSDRKSEVRHFRAAHFRKEVKQFRERARDFLSSIPLDLLSNSLGEPSSFLVRFDHDGVGHGSVAWLAPAHESRQRVYTEVLDLWCAASL